MNPWEAVRLMRKYSICKQCGNENVGNGEGTLRIEDETFERSCKCGWTVTIGPKGSVSTE